MPRVLGRPYEVLTAEEYLRNGDDIVVNRETVDGHRAIHSHDFIEIAYIAEGEGEHLMEGEKDRISKGDVFLLSSHVLHAFTSQPERPLVVYNCIFRPLSLDEAFSGCKDFVDVAYRYLFEAISQKEPPRRFLKLTGQNTGRVGRLMEEMLEEYKLREDGYIQMLRSDLMKLVIRIFRLYRAGDGGRNVDAYHRLVVQDAMAYLKDNYARDVKCEGLAARFYLSEGYFSRLFKEVTGRTIVKALQEIRIEAACSLLAGTDLPVGEVALRVGYSDVKFFYRLFRQQCGQSPGDYRKSNL